MQFLITFFSKKDWIKTNMIFYLTRPLLLGEAPHPLLNPPLLRREGLKAWPAGPVLANKLSPLRGCS